MKHTHKILVEKEDVHEIVCNKCGEPCRSFYWPDYPSIGPHVEIVASWGYGSRKDMTTEEAHLCEDCWEAFIATFKIPVQVEDNYP